jgi:hypothetical protein
VLQDGATDFYPTPAESSQSTSIFLQEAFQILIKPCAMVMVELVCGLEQRKKKTESGFFVKACDMF